MTPFIVLNCLNIFPSKSQAHLIVLTDRFEPNSVDLNRSKPYLIILMASVQVQLRWAKEAVRRAVSNGGRNCSASALHGLGMKLHHMADSLEHYVMFTLATGWAELEEVSCHFCSKSLLGGQASIERMSKSHGFANLEYL